MAAVGINANDAAAYPDDAPAKMAEEIHERGYSFPYLYDATQEVAKAYRAACTPDFFVFDGRRKLVYRGQLDGSRPGNGIPVSGVDLCGEARCRIGRSSPANRAKTKHRMQHQVAAGQ